MSDLSTLLYFRNAKRKLAPYAAPIGVACNVLLLWLIIKKSTPTMRNFKKVLLLTCVTELAFSAMNIVFVLTLTVEGDTYFCVIEGIFGHLPPFWTYIGYDAFLYFVYASVTNTTVVFFYRYLVVCRSKTLNGWLFMCCIGAGWMCIFLYVTILTYQFVNDLPDSQIYEKLTAAGFPNNGSFHNYIKCRVAKFGNYSTYGAVPFTTIAYVAVIVMSFAVQRNFKRLRSMLSSEERRFHREITAILWVEAGTPFVTVVLVIYYDISKLAIPNMPFNWFAEFIWLLTLIGPTFTAIIKILSIRAFRNAIYRPIKNRFYKNRNMVDVVQISMSLPSRPSKLPKSYSSDANFMRR